MQFEPLKIFQIRPHGGNGAQRTAGACLLLVGLLLVGAGCANKTPPDPMAEAADSGERPVAMLGESHFFDGSVTATVTVSRGFNRGAKGGQGAKGGGHQHRQKDASSAGINDSYPVGFEGATETEQREMYEDLIRLDRARRAAGSPMPPVTIHFKLEGQSAAPVEVEILELNSDLGNFAVRPAKVSVSSSQPAEVDPMVSQLGVTSDEIPVKVVLRVGGKKETQTIPVKSIFTAIEKEKK